MLFSRSCPVWGISPPSGWVVSVLYVQSEIIVEMIITHRKCCPGFGFVTQFMGLYPASGRNNDTGMMSRGRVTLITRRFRRASGLCSGPAGKNMDVHACERIHECAAGFHVKYHHMGVPQYGSVADAPTG